ncbi:peptide chain release factor-like protein, partial [Providencia rettgeri]
RGCNPTSSKFIHTWLRFGEIMRGSLRAKHVATGITVKVQSERSQHANKKLAKQLIQWKLDEYQSKQSNTLDKQRHQSHYQIERGNATMTFIGNEFKRLI